LTRVVKALASLQGSCAQHYDTDTGFLRSNQTNIGHHYACTSGILILHVATTNLIVSPSRYSEGSYFSGIIG